MSIFLFFLSIALGYLGEKNVRQRIRNRRNRRDHLSRSRDGLFPSQR
jgi:hypothetical protein